MKRGIRIPFLSVLMASFLLLSNAMAQREYPAVDRPHSSMHFPVLSSGGFFPLEVGNEWVYSNGDDIFKVQVLREAEEANGRKYFEVSGYFPEDSAKVRKLRRGGNDTVVEYNPNGEDFLWYRFGTYDSVVTFESNGEIPCITGSTIISGGIREAIATPAGVFADTLRISFHSRCADGGLLSENYATGVGLVQRVVETFAGPRTYRLASAQVGPRVMPAASFGVQVSMDSPLYDNNLMPSLIYNPWPTARLMLVVRNTSETPVNFTFRTSQRFDFVVRDARGEEVLRWSDRRLFLDVVERETLVNGSWHFPVDLTLKGRHEEVLPPGSYTLTGYLTADNWETGTAGVSGTIAFAIRNIY